MDRKDELKYRILLTVALIALSAIVLLLVLRFRDDTLAEFAYDQVDGGAVIRGYSGDPTTLEIPEKIDGLTVIAIAPEAFASQTRIQEVVLPDTLTEIGEAAFADCTALEEIEAPGVRVIRAEAFQGCVKLETVTFSKKLATIEDRAFQSCSRLSALKAPSTLQEIGTDAFAGCGNLHLEVSENKLAAEIALQYGLSTDGSDTSDGLWLRVVGATLLLGAFVWVVWIVISKIQRSKQGR